MSIEKLINISDMSKITGISTKKLRYLDKCNKLKPVKTGETGYRYYSQSQVLEALKLVDKRVVIAYTILNYQSNKENDIKNSDDIKIAVIKNNEFIERVREHEQVSKVLGMYDIWYGENKGLNMEEIIRMAIKGHVSKVYYDNKAQFVVGDWNNYKYWLSLMGTELIDINDIEMGR